MLGEAVCPPPGHCPTPARAHNADVKRYLRARRYRLPTSPVLNPAAMFSLPGVGDQLVWATGSGGNWSMPSARTHVSIRDQSRQLAAAGYQPERISQDAGCGMSICLLQTIKSGEVE